MPPVAKKNLPKWLIILFTVAGFVSTIAIVIRLLTPTTPKIPVTSTITTNLDGSTTVISGISFQGSTPDLPQELPILQAQSFINGDDLINTLIENYQLSPHPQASNVWTGENYTLVKVEQVGQYILGSSQPYPTPATMDDTEAISRASQLLNEVLPNQQLQALSTKLSYFNDDHGEPTDRNNALGAVVPFSYVVEGVPFNSTSTTAPLAEVTLDNQYQLKKLSFFTQFTSYGTVRRQQVLSVDDAIRNVNNGQGAVAEIFQENYEDLDLDSLTSGTMTNLELVYKLDPQTSLAYPFYMFSGTAIMRNGNQANVVLSTPAVATE